MALRPTRSLLALLAAALMAGCGGGGDASTTATTVPTGHGAGGVELRKFGSFDRPVYVAQPPGSTDLFVVEQGGAVRIVREGQTLGKPFLDISDQVTATGEQGLLSIAFAPGYQESHLFYVYFTGRDDQNQHVAEFKADDAGTAADPSSQREVLNMQDFAPNHNGGQLQFGPDGLLYIGTGDGGLENDVRRTAQDLSSPLGKLLRIDPHPNDDQPYAIPADNPFVGNEGARGEIYAYGLRNPWRFSFDRENGALTIGDVGQNAQEEIDYMPAGLGFGANFGWSAFEGTDRFNSDVDAPDAVPPAFTYGRDRGCSVTGGYVVRDPALPSLYGRYVYGDYCKGDLRSFVPKPGGGGLPSEAGGDKPLGLNVPSLSSFGEDNKGHVYAVSLDGDGFRILPD